MRNIIAFCAIMCALAPLEARSMESSIGIAFNDQVHMLEARGYPELFGGKERFDAEMAKLRKIAESDTRPYIIVIPEEYAPLSWQVKCIMQSRDAPCTTNVKLTDFQNCDSSLITPCEPYLIFDVYAGYDTRGKWSADIFSGFADYDRRGLTITECIALLVQQPDLLYHGFNIVAGGSYKIRNGWDGCAWTGIGVWTTNPSQPHGPVFELRQKWFKLSAYIEDSARFQFPSCKER